MSAGALVRWQVLAAETGTRDPTLSTELLVGGEGKNKGGKGGRKESVES